METWEDYVKMLGSNIELPETEPNAFETLLMDVRENMTKRQQKLMDSKEKRLSSIFFLLLGATSMHFNSFRRAMVLKIRMDANIVHAPCPPWKILLYRCFVAMLFAVTAQHQMVFAKSASGNL